MYTPKRLKSNNRGDSPLSSPFPSLKLSSDRVTPARGISTPSRLRDTPSRVGSATRAGTPSRGTTVLEQDESYQLLAYGGNLPVKVAELLAATDGTNISARIEPSGWVVVIENRKLLVWRVSSNARKTVSCFEFQLQATAARHESCLVSVLETNYDNNSSLGKTSLICVSVEGVVRYWPSVTQPTLYVEGAVSIGGDKKCCCVQSVMPYGCVVVTDTNELYQLSPSNSNISCLHISANTGVLSSIGKRMSSFWSQPVVTVCKYPPVICNGTIDNDAGERFVFVSIDNKLQKWELLGTSFGTSKMVYQVDLRTCVNDYAGVTEFAASASVDDVQLVDMKTTGYGIVMLLRLFLADETILILGTFKVNVDDYAFERLQKINDEESSLGSDLNLLVPFGGYQAYISNINTIISQPLSKSSREPVKVSLRKGVGIVGVGCIGSDVVYLSQRDGLVNLKVAYVAEPILLEQNQVNMINEPATDVTLQTTDIYGLLRSAFILHSQGKVHNILHVIAAVEPSLEVADAVRKVSSELLNGYPPSDPRWSTGNSAFPPSSVLLLNQLRDKEKIHEEYLNFLSIYDVLEKVSDVELIDGVKISLCENGEMLRCAITLLEMPHNLSTLVDDVINSTSLDMEVDSELLTEEINRKDLFFAKVSNVSTFFSALLKLEGDKLSVLHAIQEQVDVILYVSEIVTLCFQSAWQYRQNTAHKYTSTSHIPWTSSSSGSRNRTLLSHQIDLIISQALGNVDSVKSGCGLTRQVILLSDLLFDGYLREVAAMKESGDEASGTIEDEYDRERTQIITALMNLGYIEEATTLAEHYKDFQMLIILCEKANDNSKLKYYKVLFKNDGFNDVLYKWYVEKGAWKELMTAQDEADNFDSMLATHKQLSWLHFLGANEYTKASDVLTHLASEEKELSDRKKSMLVLANLSILAADAPPEMIEAKISTIDPQLDILNYQEQILKGLGKDPSESTPLAPEELIKLCLDESVEVLSEAQYITLVELLQFVSLYRQQFLLDIWTKCVLQEEWDATGNVDSVAVVSEKTFYKCLKYWRDVGALIHDNVPMLKELTARFGKAGSPSLLHQLKVCYEALGMQELSVGV